VRTARHNAGAFVPWAAAAPGRRSAPRTVSVGRRTDQFDTVAPHHSCRGTARTFLPSLEQVPASTSLHLQHTATFDKARQIATSNHSRALGHTRGDRVTGVGSGLGHVSAGIRHRSRLARTSPGRIHRRLHAWVLRIPVHLSSRLWRLRSRLLPHRTATASTVTSVLLAGLPVLGLRRYSLRSPSAHTPVSRHAPWHVVLHTVALHVGRHSGLHTSSWVLWRVATRGHRPTCRSAHRSAHEAWHRPSRKARHRPSRRTCSGHGRHRATRHADRRVLHGWRLRSTGASRHCRSSVPTDDSAGTVVRGDVRVVAMFWLTVQHRHRFHSSLHKRCTHQRQVRWKVVTPIRSPTAASAFVEEALSTKTRSFVWYGSASSPICILHCDRSIICLMIAPPLPMRTPAELCGMSKRI
jgi:hypothetical protein